METTNILVTLGIATVLVIGGAIVYKYLKPTKEITVDGEVSFDDAVAWFKEKHPKKNQDNCIMVNDSNTIFGPLIKKDGYESIGLLILGKREKVKYCLVIHAKSFDSKTKKMFGDKDLIKLA